MTSSSSSPGGGRNEAWAFLTTDGYERQRLWIVRHTVFGAAMLTEYSGFADKTSAQAFADQVRDLDQAGADEAFVRLGMPLLA